jgi:outer membrane immunogenic protein
MRLKSLLRRVFVSRAGLGVGLCVTTQALAANSIGRVATITPSVTGAVSGRPFSVSAGDKVRTDETLRTDADGEARVRFADNTELVIFSRSSITIDQFILSSPDRARNVVMSTSDGTFAFNTGKSPSEAYALDTSAGMLTPHGTKFTFSVRDQRLRLDVQEGTVTFCPRGLSRAYCVDATPGRSVMGMAGARAQIVPRGAVGGIATNEEKPGLVIPSGIASGLGFPFSPGVASGAGVLSGPGASSAPGVASNSGFPSGPGASSGPGVASNPGFPSGPGAPPGPGVPFGPGVLPWTGFHVSVDVGYAWDGSIVYIGPWNKGFGDRGVFGGGGIGYDYQIGSFVLGAQAEYNFANIRGDAYAYPYAVTANVDGFGSVDGRVGVVLGPALIYGIGGFSYGEVHHTIEPVWSYGSSGYSGMQTGWDLGFGVAYKITNDLSGFAEFRNYHWGTKNFSDTYAYGGNRIDQTLDTVRIGLIYRFGGPPAPIVARY